MLLIQGWIKYFLNWGGGCILSPPGYLLDGNVNVYGLLKVTFFCGVHCIDFSENFVRGHLRWTPFKSNRVWFLGLYTLTYSPYRSLHISLGADRENLFNNQELFFSW